MAYIGYTYMAMTYIAMACIVVVYIAVALGGHRSVRPADGL